jgi:predicted site-specific integrase-resolvase
LGISSKTLDNWTKEGRLQAWRNPINGRVYYERADVLGLLGRRLPQNRAVVLYCRAAPQKNGHTRESAEIRLREQENRCRDYCTKAEIRVDRVISELARGGSVKGRKGLAELMDLVLRKQVSMVVVETPDRLCRWGMGDLFADFLAWHGVKLHVIHPALRLQEYQEELTEDLATVVYEARGLMGT